MRKVNLDIALKDKKSKTGSFMFIGADFIPPTKFTFYHPSIVSSVDSSWSVEHQADIATLKAWDLFYNDGK